MVALTGDQQARLAAAITNATGKQVNLKVVLDPSIIGGLVATVGDTVIDGSVRSRLDRAKGPTLARNSTSHASFPSGSARCTRSIHCG